MYASFSPLQICINKILLYSLAGCINYENVRIEFTFQFSQGNLNRDFVPKVYFPFHTNKLGVVRGYFVPTLINNFSVLKKTLCAKYAIVKL